MGRGDVCGGVYVRNSMYGFNERHESINQSNEMK